MPTVLPQVRYMMNPVSQQVMVVDYREAKRLAGYGWLRVIRVKDQWLRLKPKEQPPQSKAVH